MPNTRNMASETAKKGRLKTTVITVVSLLGLGATVIYALISSLSPPSGPQRFGDTNITISSDPNPPQQGLNKLQVRLATADGKSISDGRVELKYGREAMGTLTFAPVLASGDGVYQSQVDFDEPGAWNVILTLRRAGTPDLSAKYLYNIGASSKGGKSLTGTVRIAPALTGKVAPGDVLFVIARKGPGPPLAVKRIADPAYPYSFRIGPEDMVMGGVAFEGEVSMVARIKKGGAAGPAQRGDLEGAYPGNPVKIGAPPIEIVIDHEL